MGKRFTKLAMSKPIGKVLDSKVGKGMVKVGNTITGGINKFGTKIGKDLFGSPELDKKQREDAKKLNQEYSGRPSSFRYGIQKRKIT